jgi:protein arginine kinase activator
MKCEICHKRDATTAYTHIVDDIKKTLLLCADCIPEEKVDSKQGMSADSVAAGEQVEQEVPTLIKKVKVEFSAAPPAEGLVAGECAGCGMTYEQFKKAGRLGCHRCYEAFGSQLERLLKRIHGADKHCGKGRIELRELLLSEDDLKQLEQELKEAVQREDFERAAQVRDQIRSMELDMDAGGPAN